MRLPDKSVQRRVALTLSHLCLPDDQRTIFIENNGSTSRFFTACYLIRFLRLIKAILLK